MGIDLAKNVFAGQEVDETGKPMLVKPKVELADLFWLTFGRAIQRRLIPDAGIGPLISSPPAEGRPS